MKIKMNKEDLKKLHDTSPLIPCIERKEFNEINLNTNEKHYYRLADPELYIILRNLKDLNNEGPFSMTHQFEGQGRICLTVTKPSNNETYRIYIYEMDRLALIEKVFGSKVSLNPALTPRISNRQFGARVRGLTWDDYTLANQIKNDHGNGWYRLYTESIDSLVLAIQHLAYMVRFVNAEWMGLGAGRTQAKLYANLHTSLCCRFISFKISAFGSNGEEKPLYFFEIEQMGESYLWMTQNSPNLYPERGKALLDALIRLARGQRIKALLMDM
ncbi:hypothetical protein [Rufibacter immobilis]|uniref:hypothetical protein n=1 Tax=Rufibacter immobilis TaxID=1348778 RepID=UPI0035EC231B